MGPKPSQPQTGELFGYPLRDHLNLKHPLILLGDRIQWERIDALVADQFKSRTGRPATSPRLIAGLLYLQHAFDLSDEEVVATWVENPCQRRLKTDPGCRSKTDPPGHAIERVTSPQSGGLSLLAGHLSGTHLVA